MRTFILAFNILIITSLSFAEEEAVNEQCLYKDSLGIFRSVIGRESVPEEFREDIRCSVVRTRRDPIPVETTNDPVNDTPLFSIDGVIPKVTVNDVSKFIEENGSPFTRPEDVEISGNERRLNMITSMGTIKLRWPRSIESYFGKVPDKAVKDAWFAASKALSQNSFPASLQNAKYNWQLVLMENVPPAIDPSQGQSGNCHPGWMTPPADIFIAAKHVASQCSDRMMSQSNALNELTQVMVHELGHAVEFQFMGGAFLKKERWHNEGFATWFQTLAMRYVSSGSKEASRDALRVRARKAFEVASNWTFREFQGSPEDYARAYGLIAVIAEKRSIGALTRIYSTMDKSSLSFAEAVNKELMWDEKRWHVEAKKHLGL